MLACPNTTHNIPDIRSTMIFIIITPHVLKIMMNEDIYNVLLDVSHRFGLGAIKYGDHNWQKGIPPVHLIYL